MVVSPERFLTKICMVSDNSGEADREFGAEECISNVCGDMRDSGCAVFEDGGEATVGDEIRRTHESRLF